MINIKKAVFVKSTLSWQDPPSPRFPEVAFVGRSNVGKSSLINCLLHRKNIARVSKQPGKTRTLNYFLIDDCCYFVDLPGYGFARISKKEKAGWQKAIEGYLLNSPYLRMVLVLVDGKVGAKDSDLQLVEWLEDHQIPLTIIATKIDKVTRGARAAQLKNIRQSLNLTGETPVILFSAKDSTGRNETLKLIEQAIR